MIIWNIVMTHTNKLHIDKNMCMVSVPLNFKGDTKVYRTTKISMGNLAKFQKIGGLNILEARFEGVSIIWSKSQLDIKMYDRLQYTSTIFV